MVFLNLKSVVHEDMQRPAQVTRKRRPRPIQRTLKKKEENYSRSETKKCKSFFSQSKVHETGTNWSPLWHPSILWYWTDKVAARRNKVDIVPVFFFFCVFYLCLRSTAFVAAVLKNNFTVLSFFLIPPNWKCGCTSTTTKKGLPYVHWVQHLVLFGARPTRRFVTLVETVLSVHRRSVLCPLQHTYTHAQKKKPKKKPQRR